MIDQAGDSIGRNAQTFIKNPAQEILTAGMAALGRSCSILERNPVILAATSPIQVTERQTGKGGEVTVVCGEAIPAGGGDQIAGETAPKGI